MKFFIDNVWLVLTALVSGAALAWPVLTRSKHNLTILQATQLINKDNTVIVDVRAPEDFAAGHLRSAKNIPLRELPARIKELDKSRPVLVVCTAGVQSVKGAVLLAQAGFSEAYSLDGGFDAWQAQGLPVLK